eukprot:TRINITY_DN26448_c0_g1_i1.p1 TRINITY_DN26448_c0_g1~~TRINITY_DN26448_c0_g1_i1.p1  ORF type:complete len:279 (+),score=58.84 TRINITY_DN26448_c0_g1_i1:142-978(+)
MAAVSAHALAAVAPAVAAGRTSFVQGQALRSSASVAICSRGSRLVVRAASDKPVKADRQTWFASPQSLSYLDGSLPGDFGFDPLGLSDPEGAGQFVDPNWLAYAELINGRWAMLGAAGMVAPELLGKLGLIPASTGVVWFKSGVIPPLGSYNYWADAYALFILEVVLVAFAEHRRAQDYYKPGYGSKTPLLGLEKFLGGSGSPAYPGGPFFNFLNFGKDEASMKVLKTKEVKNSRLAMLAVLGFFIQGIVTGEGPIQNLFDHLANPTGANILTNLKIH